MTENIPSFQRPVIPVVGGGSQDKKTESQQAIQDHFSNNRDQVSSSFADKLRMLEYPKHDFERVAIKDINQLLNEISKELNLPTFDIPEANIYSVPKSLYQEIDGRGNTDSDGFTAYQEQAIVLNSESLDHAYSRITVLLHEMIHLKGFVSLETDETETELRRGGLKIRSSIKKKREHQRNLRHFIGLNEAVVSELEKRIFPKVIERNPHLAHEREVLKSERGKAGLAHAMKKEHLPEDEFAYAYAKGDSPKEDGWEGYMFPYHHQRMVLSYILEAIQKTYPEEFPTRDDVFRIFLMAHFGGQLKPLARVIEDTFGTGSFRMVGTMTGQDAESAYRVLAYLKKNTPLEVRK